MTQVPSLASAEHDAITEGLTFGAVIGALDRFCVHHLGIQPPAHPPSVRYYIDGEAQKWQKLSHWSGFYEPLVSVAGFIGENVYGDSTIDLAKFIPLFST